jgi:anti-sigma factor RsiW
MKHLEAGQLVDLARGLIEDGEAAALRPHLDDCDRCRAALDRLSLVVRTARAASSVPASAVREANALTAAPPSQAFGAIGARLVFDNFLQPLMAGVRGTAQDRHLLFEADHWAIDLRVVRSDRALSITGQLANAAAPTQGCAGVAVLAWSTDGVVGRGLTGSLGEFMIACPDVAHLTLEIRSSPAITIGIPPART